MEKKCLGWTGLLRQEGKADPAQSGAITELCDEQLLKLRYPRSALTNTFFVDSALALSLWSMY
jgi:hypothetical protein